MGKLALKTNNPIGLIAAVLYGPYKPIAKGIEVFAPFRGGIGDTITLDEKQSWEFIRLLFFISLTFIGRLTEFL